MKKNALGNYASFSSANFEPKGKNDKLANTAQ
jgi:hypothetical protein